MRHRDSNNSGLSAITSVGFHRGGLLRYWSEDNGTGSVHNLPDDQVVEMRIRGKVQFFDGARTHETGTYFGYRTSIVWYTREGSGTHLLKLSIWPLRQAL